LNLALYVGGIIGTFRLSKESMEARKDKMPLKNYTTTIAPEKSIAEIEANLSMHGATDIHKQYDGQGNIVAISFGINTEHGFLPFRLPAKPEAVRQILIDEKAKGKLNIPKKTASDIGHARRVTWRIIKDWIDAQIALIEMNMAQIEEIFLPYMLNPQGETLFDALAEDGFKKLLTENVK